MSAHDDIWTTVTEQQWKASLATATSVPAAPATATASAPAATQSGWISKVLRRG